ncbi:rhodanese family protein [Snodgrassella sp. CFCC 13594]|uniref:rhodanese family protein n=1 Tax=Snodgrassella sp. CFCC 13594 TaxID=1775559 RepID=UPI000835CBAD|nr:rhodanese family protein [Snodgrassella sp. CFCC 13594]
MTTNLQTLPASEVNELIHHGALLVDIRSPDEFAKEHIAGALNLPIDQLKQDPSALSLNCADKIIFNCLSGKRTSMNAEFLSSCVVCQAYLLEGGLESWKRARLPSIKDDKKPIELQRQVQITAGLLVLAGTVMGAIFSPWFYVVPAFIGAGLMFAGLSGFCGMARLLMKAPWNN